MVDKVTFFVSYYEAAKLLPESEQGAFLMGVLGYAFEGVEPKFEGSQKLAYTLIKPNIDSSVRSRDAGKSGGRPKKETKSKTPSETPLKTPGKTTSKTNKDMDRDMEKDRDVEMDDGEIDPLDRSISPSDASGDAAAADAAPPAAKDEGPKCPECGGGMRYDSSGMFWRCRDDACRATVSLMELAGLKGIDKTFARKRRASPAWVCPECGQKVECDGKTSVRICPTHGAVEAVIADV